MSTIGQTISSYAFDYDAKSKTFSAEISMIEANNLKVFGMLYDDAIDTGFVMMSAKTDRLAEFFMEETIKNVDGDITHWVFKPMQSSVRRNPKLAGVKVIVWNT